MRLPVLNSLWVSRRHIFASLFSIRVACVVGSRPCPLPPSISMSASTCTLRTAISSSHIPRSSVHNVKRPASTMTTGWNTGTQKLVSGFHQDAPHRPLPPLPHPGPTYPIPKRTMLLTDNFIQSPPCHASTPTTPYGMRRVRDLGCG